MIVFIVVYVSDLFDSRGEEESGTDDARKVSDIGDTFGGADTAFGTVGKTVLFGVDGGLFVSISDDGDMFTSG